MTAETVTPPTGPPIAAGTLTPNHPTSPSGISFRSASRSPVPIGPELLEPSPGKATALVLADAALPAEVVLGEKGVLVSISLLETVSVEFDPEGPTSVLIIERGYVVAKAVANSAVSQTSCEVTDCITNTRTLEKPGDEAYE